MYNKDIAFKEKKILIEYIFLNKNYKKPKNLWKTFLYLIN